MLKLFNFSSEFCTGFKLNNFLSRDNDFFFSCRIDTCSCALFNYSECTETNKSNFVIVSHGIGDCCKSCVQRCFCVSFCKVCLFGNSID